MKAVRLLGGGHPVQHEEIAVSQLGEFESVEQALRWCNSAEFAPARALRSRFAKMNAIAVPGV